MAACHIEASDGSACHQGIILLNYYLVMYEIVIKEAPADITMDNRQHIIAISVD